MLRQADLPDLCFVPDDHTFWMDDAQRVVFAGWAKATDIGDIGSYRHISDRGLTAFAGRMWPKSQMWHADKTWAQQLTSYWDSHPVVDSGQGLDGVFAAVALTPAGGGKIVSDPLSVALIYRAETDDFTVYSTSPRLAARTAAPEGREPERDPLGVAWLPFLGWIVGDRTGYTSTRVIPMGAYVDIHPAFGSRLRFSNPTPWSADLPSTEAELVDMVYDDLTASVRSIAMLRAPARTADITGGKDSRLLLALLLQEKLTDEFTFRTMGFEHSPDAIVGRQIAERFRLTHNHSAPVPMSEQHFRRRLATHVFQTAGTFSAWEFKGDLSASSTLRATGCVGEAFRTHFKKYPFMPTVADLRREFYGRSGLHGESILRRDVVAELLDVLDAELVQRVDAGGSTPQDLADSFYWRQRNRRWFGTYEELGQAGRVFPLYSLLGLQAAFMLGPVKRRLETLHFEVMRRACPELAKMPFADNGWSENLLSSVPDGDQFLVPPIRHDGKGPAPTQWRPQRLLDNVDVARELLVDGHDRSSPLYAVLDRSAVERTLRHPDKASMPMCRQLFGALAAAVWLGRHESADRIGGPSAITAPERARGTVAARPRHWSPNPRVRDRIRGRLSR